MHRSTVDLQTDVDTAVQRLYHTFSSCRLDASRPISGYGVTITDEQIIRSKPLRELAGEDLQTFAFRAMTTFGSVDDFRHFLPRLLEIAARDGAVGLTDLEVVFHKLKYADWRRWRPNEQAAVEAYFAAVWHHTIGDYPSVIDPDDLLCGIGGAVNDLTSYLAIWQANTAPAAVRHLAVFVDVNQEAIERNNRLSNAYWNSCNPSHADCVIDWLLQSGTREMLETAFFTEVNSIAAEQISQAVEQLARLRDLAATR